MAIGIANVGADLDSVIDWRCQELHDAILTDPAGYYVNVHTSDFPDGAVRGQLQGDPGLPRPGDQLFISEDLFGSNRHGDKRGLIGSTLIHCTFGLAGSAYCAVTVFVDGRGQLHATATPIFDFESQEPFTVDVAFTGGTRDFARAGGWATVTDLPPDDPEGPTTSLWQVRLRRL